MTFRAVTNNQTHTLDRPVSTPLLMSPNLGSHTNKQNDSPSTEGPRPRRQLIDLGGLFKADAKPKIDWESGDYVDVALSMTVSDKTKVHAIIKELVATKQPLTRDNLHQMKEQRIAQIKTKVAARKDHGKEGDSGEEDEDKEENEEEDEQQEHLDDQNDSDSGSSANDEADRQLKRHRIFDHRSESTRSQLFSIFSSLLWLVADTCCQ